MVVEMMSTELWKVIWDRGALRPPPGGYEGTLGAGG